MVLTYFVSESANTAKWKQGDISPLFKASPFYGQLYVGVTGSGAVSSLNYQHTSTDCFFDTTQALENVLCL